MDTREKVLALLDDVLCLKGRATEFSDRTVLLGAIPELDSMAVLALITELEDRFGFTMVDDEIDGATFATLGSLVEYVNSKKQD